MKAYDATDGNVDTLMKLNAYAKYHLSPMGLLWNREAKELGINIEGLEDQEIKQKIRDKRGGEVKKDLKPIPAGNKGLKKLPTKVRNKMGFMKSGGAVMVQARGCGAIMPGKQKMTKVPRS